MFASGFSIALRTVDNSSESAIEGSPRRLPAKLGTESFVSVEKMSPENLPRILVVDDSPSNLRVLVESLREDHKILVATSGELALDLIARERPDLILLDVVMPGLSGYEVCRRLKQGLRTRGIPVIFVTGRSEEQDETEGFELGAVDYITKPFRVPVVRARIRNHLELKRLRDHFELQSRIDALTGIANRRSFEEFLAEAWPVAAESGSPVSAILVDIDHFKAYNDHYGHQGGDETLRRVAAALQEVRRGSRDLIARYGGEEFVCVLPESDLAAARVVAERLRAAVENLAIPHACSSAADRVTLSLGVASCLAGEVAEPSALLEAADRALYRSKADGRNRVTG